MSLDIVILAAGQGTRMRSALPKVLHPVAGQVRVAQGHHCRVQRYPQGRLRSPAGTSVLHGRQHRRSHRESEETVITRASGNGRVKDAGTARVLSREASEWL